MEARSAVAADKVVGSVNYIIAQISLEQKDSIMTGEQEERSKLLDHEEVHLVIDYWDGPREGVADGRE